MVLLIIVQFTSVFVCLFVCLFLSVFVGGCGDDYNYHGHMADSLPYCRITEWLPQICIMHIQSGS